MRKENEERAKKMKVGKMRKQGKAEPDKEKEDKAKKMRQGLKVLKEIKK